MNNHVDNLQCMSKADHIVLYATGYVASDSTRKKISEANSGEKGSNAKFTCKDVEKIRELPSEGKLTQIEIAKMFNVSQVAISDIKRRRSWKKS